MAELLLEIFSEEIPARMQRRALEDFTRLVCDGLVEAGLSYGAKQGYVTPRRLVLILDQLPMQSQETREERKGPRVDAPEKALEGFLRSTGLNKDDLEIREEKKGKVYFATLTNPGRASGEIVADVLDKTIKNFPWPKSMRWGENSLKWVRPMHSILALMIDGEDTQIIDFEIGGIQAGNKSQGHRFMSPGDLTIKNPDDFMDKMAKNFVILSSSERQDTIRNDAKNAAFAIGLELIENEKLIAENAGLTEYPVVYIGEIDPEFEELPAEVIETSMAEHQKFLSLRDPKSGKIAGYVVVANRSTADNGAKILAGNAKVLKARLADAKFFWENDLRVAKEGMQPWLDALQNVTFYNKLGSQSDRIMRIETLAEELASNLGADEAQAKQAAHFAKADLSSQMVYEFPELQGEMGKYYAQAAGFANEVANAAAEH